MFGENKGPCNSFVYCLALLKSKIEDFKREKETSFSHLSSWFCIIHLTLNDFVDLVDTLHCDQCIYMRLKVLFSF